MKVIEKLRELKTRRNKNLELADKLTADIGKLCELAELYTEALLDLIEKLADDLEESHENEIAGGHYGDDQATCVYCRHIAEARAMLKKNQK